VSLLFDCCHSFGEQGSVEQVYEAVSASRPAHIISVLPVTSALTHKPTVKLESTCLYTALGADVWLGPFHYPMGPQDRAHHARWLREAPALLEAGKIKPLRWRHAGGLLDVEAGFKTMREGRVSGEKLV
jgi:hypothetical protein